MPPSERAWPRQRATFNNQREDFAPAAGSCLTGLRERTAAVFLGTEPGAGTGFRDLSVES